MTKNPPRATITTSSPATPGLDDIVYHLPKRHESKERNNKIEKLEDKVQQLEDKVQQLEGKVQQREDKVQQLKDKLRQAHAQTAIADQTVEFLTGGLKVSCTYNCLDPLYQTGVLPVDDPYENATMRRPCAAHAGSA